MEGNGNMCEYGYLVIAPEFNLLSLGVPLCGIIHKRDWISTRGCSATVVLCNSVLKKNYLVLELSYVTKKEVNFLMWMLIMQSIIYCRYNSFALWPLDLVAGPIKWKWLFLFQTTYMYCTCTRAYWQQLLLEYGNPSIL